MEVGKWQAENAARCVGAVLDQDWTVASMNEQQARETLKKAIQKDGSLDDAGAYLLWYVGTTTATLDGVFAADELEAIAWWMRNTAKEESSRE